MADASTLPDGCEVNGDGSVTMQLIYPVSYSVGSEQITVTELRIRRRTVEDNLAIKKLEYGADVAAALIERLAGLPAVAVRKMDDLDSERFAAVVESFTRPGRVTGSGASA